MKNIVIAVATISLGLYQGANAGPVEDLAAIDFSLRFPAALAKFSSYADVAGFGGASAGSRYSTSVNPAATDWMANSEHPYSFSPQFSRIRFDKAPTLNITSYAVGASTPLGTFQPAVATIRNEGGQTGDFLLIQGDYAQLQWGKKLSDDLAIGANINHSSFNTQGGLGGTLLSDGISDTTGLRAGGLWAASKKLLVGLVLDSSRTHSATNLFELGCFCFVHVNDAGHSSSVRAGASFEYAELSSIYVDYQHGRYQNSTGALSSNMIFAGAEHLVLPWLFVRAGLTYDSRGFTSPTLGVGISPSKTTSIDIAYQRDMFPDLRPEFGRSRLLNVSVSFAL